MARGPSRIKGLIDSSLRLLVNSINGRERGAERGGEVDIRDCYEEFRDT